MSKWTHSICGGCFSELRPGREPVKVTGLPPETCCFCGQQTDEGIYIRHSPNDHRLRCHKGTKHKD